MVLLRGSIPLARTKKKGAIMGIGEDDRKDALRLMLETHSFIHLLGCEWREKRDKILLALADSRIDYLRIIRMLDETADILTCEHKNCLNLPHGDWDFCFYHGRSKEDWRDREK